MMTEDPYPTLDEDDPTESGRVLDVGPVAHEGKTELSGAPNKRATSKIGDRHREIARRLIASLLP